MKGQINFANKKVLVAGAGISGIAAYDLLKKLGAKPTLYDAKEDLDKQALGAKTADGAQTSILLGEVSNEVLDSYDLLVASPGVPTDTGLPKYFYNAGKPVIGEIELAYQAGKGNIIAITGTNGKTTTTALTGEITRKYYGESFVVGNIGIPYTKVASDTKDDSVIVAEISSFQLETAVEFHPKVSAVLNITPDHLNRHHTMENYIAVKASITKNQTEEDFVVLNYEDKETREIAKQVKSKVLFFSSERELAEGCFLKDEDIWYADENGPRRLMNIHEMKLLGKHNVENVMAAICMCYAYGIPMDSILTSVKEFTAVEHRIEYVATKNGVDYYNDSKGTNPDAAIKGIQAMNKPTVLIGGGYDKDSTYDEWIEAFDNKVKALVLIGQTADKIEECARKHGFEKIYKEDSLENAVSTCARLAVSGDAVLLSPACASWGMFPNYEVRGRIFKELVNKIPE